MTWNDCNGWKLPPKSAWKSHSQDVRPPTYNAVHIICCLNIRLGTSVSGDMLPLDLPIIPITCIGSRWHTSLDVSDDSFLGVIWTRSTVIPPPSFGDSLLPGNEGESESRISRAVFYYWLSNLPQVLERFVLRSIAGLSLQIMLISFSSLQVIKDIHWKIAVDDRAMIRCTRSHIFHCSELLYQ